MWFQQIWFPAKAEKEGEEKNQTFFTGEEAEKLFHWRENAGLIQHRQHWAIMGHVAQWQRPGSALRIPGNLSLCKPLSVTRRLRWHLQHRSHMITHIKVLRSLVKKWNRKTFAQNFTSLGMVLLEANIYYKQNEKILGVLFFTLQKYLLKL